MTWLNTPYHHQASVKHVGCDCLGLVRGIAKEVAGYEPAEPPPYNPSWAEISSRDDLLDAAHKYLVFKPHRTWEAGDVLVFKMFPRSAAKHCGIVAFNNKMIHAYDPHGVVETTLTDDWIGKIKAVFRFPFVGA